jgi:hypothetical protein
VATPHVHAGVADLYPGLVAGGQLHSRSARDSFSPISRSEERGAIWFLFWWLFLHRRLRSRQRGLCPKTQATCYFKADHFLKARLRFYPRRSGKSCDFPEAKPFGFSLECDSRNSRLLPPSSDASPHRLPFSSPVTTPVSTATGCGLYAHIKNKSSRKYFKS